MSSTRRLLSGGEESKKEGSGKDGEKMEVMEEKGSGEEESKKDTPKKDRGKQMRKAVGMLRGPK